MHAAGTWIKIQMYTHLVGPHMHVCARTHTHTQTHTHIQTQTHKHTNPLRPSSISACVQSFRDSLSAFIFSNVGCPICSTTGNINRPTIAFTEINTVEYSPSPSLSLSPFLCLFRSPQITGASFF